MAVEMLHELLVYVPADNPELQALVTSVRDKFGKAVDNCAVPVWPAAAIAASQPAKAVVHARFCRSVHLAAGLCSFCDILPSKFLQSMVLETLIGRRLVAHLRGGFSNVAATTAKLAILVDMMPSDWFGSGIPKEAAGLHELLSSFARHLEGQRVEALRHNKGEVTASALRLASMLSKVGDDQLSKRLARMFGGDR
ncbi:unnamed protein product [Ostreobium quekettii]|uniref:Uncharacterized protein n=1 Tax=Ostreobium quekettii TaxID=121088 RepID=A0A8S1J750_9CHLO|nr:unnamed protein product [Ostreobium quekettii]